MRYLRKNMKQYFQALILLLALFMQTVSAQSVANPKVTYFHNDITGTAVAATDEKGEVIWREQRRAYGEIKVDPLKPRSLDEFSVGYTGHQADKESGLTYAKARYYNKAIGRFYAPDPIPFRESDLTSFNRYTYAANNPYMFVDPDGRFPLVVPFIFGGFLYAGSTSVAQAPTHENDIHTLSGKDRAMLAAGGAVVGGVTGVVVSAVGTKEVAQTAFEETTGVELPVPSVKKVARHYFNKKAVWDKLSSGEL